LQQLHKLNALVLMAGLCSALGTSLAVAAPPPEPTPTPEPVRQSPLADAQELIKKRQWPQALSALQKLNDTRNADWHNLMGYTLRKSSPADLAGAERHYNEALRLAPRHLGALEYVGELHLMQGDLPRAEARLAALGAACDRKCEEFTDLQAEIARYKANGMRFVAK
jgi:Flp pilus assembly protein TadD